MLLSGQRQAPREWEIELLLWTVVFKVTRCVFYLEDFLYKWQPARSDSPSVNLLVVLFICLGVILLDEITIAAEM